MTSDARTVLAEWRLRLTVPVKPADALALLAAVEAVLALCDEYQAQARGDNPEDRLRQAARKAVAARFRAAVSDALEGGE